MSESLKERLARIGDEAEAAEEALEAPLPEHVKANRPGRTRSKVLQVRLNPDEYDALERIAQKRELPVSTIARETLLELIDSNNDSRGLVQLLQVLDEAMRIRSGLLKEIDCIKDVYARSTDESVAGTLMTVLGLSEDTDNTRKLSC